MEKWSPIHRRNLAQEIFGFKQTDSGESVQVTKDSFNNESPIWSPEGNEIAYFSDNNTGIWRIPTLGGSPTLVVALEHRTTKPRLWSKSGKIYYESNRNLFAVDIKTGKSSQISRFQPNDPKVNSISISPDEKRLAFVQKEGKET